MSSSVDAAPEVVLRTADDLQLWQKLLQFEFDQPGPYPFSIRLAVENDWTATFTWDVLEEYRKFLFLRATVGADMLAPPAVETAWRLHLIYNDSYWKDLCGGVLGRQIPHDCDDGGESQSSVRRRFSHTLISYRTVFGKPDENIWVEPEAKGLPLLTRMTISRHIAVDNKRLESALPVTPERIPAEHAALWVKIRDFEVDRPGSTYPFSRRLAEENGWSVEYSLLVIREYKRFLFLGSTGPMVTPSFDVDEAWHLHQGNTDSFWNDLCKDVIGRPFLHSPGNGDKEEDFLFEGIYQRTLTRYQEIFGEPPLRVWGKIDPAIDWKDRLKSLNE